MTQVKKASNLNNTFSIVVGAFFLIEGVWGLFSEVVFGILTTNTLHAVIHILLGIIGITVGIKQNARGYCTFLGLLLIIVGLLRFVPGADMLVINLFNVNKPVAVLNLVVGFLSLLVVYRKPYVETVKA